VIGFCKGRRRQRRLLAGLGWRSVPLACRPSAGAPARPDAASPSEVSACPN